MKYYILNAIRKASHVPELYSPGFGAPKNEQNVLLGKKKYFFFTVHLLNLPLFFYITLKKKAVQKVKYCKVRDRRIFMIYYRPKVKLCRTFKSTQG